MLKKSQEINSSSTAYLVFLIQGQPYKIKKQLLEKQISPDNNINEAFQNNTITMPQWVLPKSFAVIQAFINHSIEYNLANNQNCQKFFMQNLNKSQITIVINLIKILEYLGMDKLLQKLIDLFIIKTLNEQNCVYYLDETHKKLKITGQNTQCWYNLLNNSINYLANNIFQIYMKNPQRLEKVHQKILNEILDRTLKGLSLKKNTNENHKEKQIIFQLILKSKKTSSVDVLCTTLKNQILTKKINPKMHAKLSWKLNDLTSITDKKTKNFKFLQLSWNLQAIRQKNKSMQIQLCLQQGIQNQQKPFSICPFYTKLHWSIDNKSGDGSYYQQPIQLHYIDLKSPRPIIFFKIDQNLEDKIGNKKLQLNIYCAIQQTYCFVLDYILQNYNRLRIDQKKFDKDHIYAFIQGSKNKKKYSQGVFLIKYLANNELQIPKYLLQDFPYQKLPTYQVDFLKKLIRNDNPILDQIYKAEEIPRSPIHSVKDISQSNASEITQKRSNPSRPGSRGRSRRIFKDSPSKVISQKQKRRDQIFAITDIKNYLHNKNSPIAKYF